MLRGNRLFSHDEELGKKNDDIRADKTPATTRTVGRPWRGPRRKRFFIAILGIWLLYIFWKNIPTNVPSVGARGDPRFRGIHPNSNGAPTIAPKGAPPEEGRVLVEEPTKEDYEGPIRFYELAESLSIGQRYNGISPVVFAASNLKSISHLVPLACDMAIQKINNVHMMIMPREDISMDILKEINGFHKKDCPMLWHDARPDFARYSTKLRMEFAAKAALNHLNVYLNPKTILVDSASIEEAWLIQGIRAKTKEASLGLIELPPDAATELKWMTRLDAVALRAWNTVEIELLIHAPVASSGGLIRLLQSIAAADYTGSFYPKLTVELPSVVDEPTNRFLDHFKWPPHGGNKLTLRHRISSRHDSPAEASIRTIESYYPDHGQSSHVLVLSPQADLSPSYFQYLRFLVLKYKHSKSALAKADRLLGISLDMPTKLLDDSTQLHLPKTFGTIDPETAKDYEKLVSAPLIAWQAPNSNAALYFGDKWIEIHSFMNSRSKITSGIDTKSTKTFATKLVSEHFPSWMEYILEMIRARSYFMIYPAVAFDPDSPSLVTIHHELYQPPEEFTKDPADPSASEEAPPELKPDSSLEVPFDSSEAAGNEKPLTPRTSILDLLHCEGILDVPDANDLPILSFDGNDTTREVLLDNAMAYVDEFAVTNGGCATKEQRSGIMKGWSADDLFCLPEE